MDQDHCHTFTIYSSKNEFEPVKLSFYSGTKPEDIEELIRESIENLKVYTKKDKIKILAKADGKEVDLEKIPLNRIGSLILSDHDHSVSHRGKGVNASPGGLDDNIPEDEIAISHKVNVNGEEYNNVRNYESAPSKQGEAPIVNKAIAHVLQESGTPIKIGKDRPKSAAHQHKNASRYGSAKKNGHLHHETHHHAVQEHNITFQGHGDYDISSKLTSSPNKKDQDKVLYNGNLVQEDKSGDNNFVNKETPRLDANGVKSVTETTTTTIPKPIKKWNTGELFTKPIDGNDPQIYSFNKAIMPFSYMAYTSMEDKYTPKYPPPTYLDYAILSKPKSYAKSDVFKGLEITKTGELKLVDEEILKKQKGIVYDVLKRLAQSIAEGRGVVGVSLPVRIFEPRSLLERICDWWTFLPNYLVPAVDMKDPIQRMKNVVAASIAGLYVSAQQVKPFNPILGETFQATFPASGITIDIEHTSHHPPIANFLVEHPGFRFWGRYNFFANLDGNQLILHQEGPNHVDFKDGQSIVFYWGFIKVSGMLWGDRTCRHSGYMKYYDEKNKIKCVIKLGYSEDKAKAKRKDCFAGKIYYYNPEEEKKQSKKKQDEQDWKFYDMISPICDLHGSYLENLIIDGVEYWNIDRDLPSNYVPVPNPLCSDCRFREDLIWVQRNNFKHAEDWKLKLEERQRAEKKLRVEYAKQQKKNK